RSPVVTAATAEPAAVVTAAVVAEAAHVVAAAEGAVVVVMVVLAGAVRPGHEVAAAVRPTRGAAGGPGDADHEQGNDHQDEQAVRHHVTSCGRLCGVPLTPGPRPVGSESSPVSAFPSRYLSKV